MSLIQTYLTERDLQNGIARPRAAMLKYSDGRTGSIFLTLISVD